MPYSGKSKRLILRAIYIVSQAVSTFNIILFSIYLNYWMLCIRLISCVWNEFVTLARQTADWLLIDESKLIFICIYSLQRPQLDLKLARCVSIIAENSPGHNSVNWKWNWIQINLSAVLDWIVVLGMMIRHHFTIKRQWKWEQSLSIILSSSKIHKI